MQCDQVWRNYATLATFLHLWQFLECLFFVWQSFEPTLTTFHAFRQIIIVANGQILANNPTILSHCLHLRIKIFNSTNIFTTQLKFWFNFIFLFRLRTPCWCTTNKQTVTEVRLVDFAKGNPIYQVAHVLPQKYNHNLRSYRTHEGLEPMSETNFSVV